ncbi:type 4a pilus biogenesis protein PilO [bacterium]|nr:type 4a pilus biogenesis protein PilO [bacterium]
MEKYSRYYGLITFLVVTFVLGYVTFNMISPKVEELNNINADVEKQEKILKAKQQEKIVVANKLKKIKDSVIGAQKKIYAPMDSDLSNDTLFFTLYNDVLEMMKENSIKIKSLDYVYNPEEDEFVKSGNDYFVCDINLELVSNYTNLGKLIEQLYKYPYYIKFNNMDVKPYAKDKSILLTNMSIRLYAKSEPEDN